MTKNPTVYTLIKAKELLFKQISAIDFKEKPSTLRLEIRIKPVDQIQWLSQQDSITKIYGASKEHKVAIAGFGQASVVKVNSKVNLKSLFIKMRAVLSNDFPYMQWYGGIAFDCKDANFVIPAIELARNGNKMMLACNIIGKTNKQSLLNLVNSIITDIKLENSKRPLLAKRIDLPTKERWAKNVEHVLNKISQNACNKVVLARQTKLIFKNTINPWLVLKQLEAVSPNSYHFAFQFNNNVFCGASPERLFKRFGPVITSQALAGTLPQGKSSKALLSSAKDRLEHKIVVDAIAKALTPFVDQLTFPQQPQIMNLANAKHLNTPFSGQLKPGTNDEDIIRALHPTPALGGDPTLKALAIIKRIEPFKRGWYAGPVGYVGKFSSEFVVAIRSGYVYKNTLTLYAGAGIVQGSSPNAEWDEVENKISNFQKAVL